MKRGKRRRRRLEIRLNISERLGKKNNHNLVMRRKTPSKGETVNWKKGVKERSTTMGPILREVEEKAIF